MKVFCFKNPDPLMQLPPMYFTVGLIYKAEKINDYYRIKDDGDVENKTPNWRVRKEGGWGLYMDDSTFKKCFKEML